MPTQTRGRVQGRQRRLVRQGHVGRDPLTGRRTQITRRGFDTAAEAARARRELLAQVDRGQLRPAPGGLTVNELLDLYLDGLDADGRLSAKTRFDYRHYGDDYVRPHLGATQRPRRHTRDGPRLAAEADQGGRDEGRQAAGGQHRAAGSGAAGRRVQDGARCRDRGGKPDGRHAHGPGRSVRSRSTGARSRPGSSWR